MKIVWIYISFFLVFQVESEISSINYDATYKAAVVEFNLRSEPIDQRSIKENTKRVIDIINSDETKNVDIIVFPESILNDAMTPVPLSKSDEGHPLCDMSAMHWVLRRISCAAKYSSSYVVINLITEDNANAVFNTAIVFDRSGSIIAKYRKYNLHGESGIQRPPKPDVITFETDFNVTFGVFICFDLTFEEPANTLMEKGIRNFVYPTMWFSELPYLTAVQIQYAWAYANNVNLLAANANRLGTATFGSGIYTGRRDYSTTFVATEPTTKVIVAEVPIEPSPIDEIHRKRSDEPFEAITDTDYNLWKEDLGAYTIKFLSTSGVQSGEIQSNSIRCRYNVSITDLGEMRNKETYFYAVASFDGHRKYASGTSIRTAHKICSVIACTKFDDWKSCGIRHKTSSEVYRRFRFDRLDLSIDFQTSNIKVMPNTLTMNLKPLQNFHLAEIYSGDAHRIRMQLEKSNSDILTFSIYARDYQHDILNDESNQVFCENLQQTCQKMNSAWTRGISGYCLG